MSQEHPGDARRQLQAAFDLLAKHVTDPKARGCPMANAAVEITESDHPATQVIKAHKARLRARLAALCASIGAKDSRLLADQLFLLMEGARVSAQTPGARPAAAISQTNSAGVSIQLPRNTFVPRDNPDDCITCRNTFSAVTTMPSLSLWTAPTTNPDSH